MRCWCRSTKIAGILSLRLFSSVVCCSLQCLTPVVEWQKDIWFSYCCISPSVLFHADSNSDTHTHAHLFNGHMSGTTRVIWYQKGKTNLDFTEAGDNEWQWHQLGRMQVCTSLQTDNHTSTPPLSFLQVGCPSCRPTNSVKALKA